MRTGVVKLRGCHVRLHLPEPVWTMVSAVSPFEKRAVTVTPPRSGVSAVQQLSTTCTSSDIGWPSVATASAGTFVNCTCSAFTEHVAALRVPGLAYFFNVTATTE